MPFPLPRHMIAPAETALGIRLPLGYLAVLAPDNGGDLTLGEDDVWFLHPIRDDSDRKRLSRTASHVVAETTKLRADCSGFPPNAVAIAHDGGGNALILLPDERDLTTLGEAVYRWDHETDEIEKLADSLQDLRDRG